MKATGIVRRIDDLGRIVIPKEIRRTMHLHEGAALEIYTEKDEQILLKKYSPVEELADHAQKLCESMTAAVNTCSVICDRDKVIAAAGGHKKELMGRPISSRLQEIMDERAQYNGTAMISEEVSRCILLTAAPIFTDGDVTGCVMFAASPDRTNCSDAEAALAAAAAAFLGKETGE